MEDVQKPADGEDDLRGLIDVLERALPGRVLWSAADTSDYSHDRSHHAWAPAAAVVRATTTDDVATTVRACHAAGSARDRTGHGHRSGGRSQRAPG